MSVVKGWKIVRPDGTTHGGYAWPLVNAAAGQKPAEVIAAGDPHSGFTRGDPCPQFPGDGLCLAETAAAASSGGIRLSECVGLHVTYNDKDVLGSGDGKVRVSQCTVVGVWSPLAVIRRAGPLKAAGMWDANLTGADLTGAYLASAYLTGADLSDANLTRANLTGADLTGADLTGAYLASARYSAATLWPAGFDPQAAGAVLV